MSQLLQVATRGGTLNTVDGTAPPSHIHLGIPYDVAGGVAVDLTGPITHYYQGLPFTDAGRLAVEQQPPIRVGDGAAPFTAANRIAMDTAPLDRVVSGVPYTVTSAIKVEGLAPYLGVTITVHPVSVIVTEPTQAQFSVTASSGDASAITYQWQEFDGSWGNLANGGVYSGVDTDTLTINPTSVALSGNQYRCVCSNDQPGSITTNAADLVVISAESFFVKTFDGVDDVLTFDGLDNVLTFDGTP